MVHSTRWRVSALIGLTGLIGATALAASAQADTRTTLKGSQPGWMAKSVDQGPAATGDEVDFAVLVGMRDVAGARAQLADIANPDSANYGKWLSSSQFRSQYAPAAADVSAVTTWLTGAGFTVDEVVPSGMAVQVHGTVGQVQAAFATSIHNFAYQGKVLHGNVAPLSVPSSVAGRLTDVVGVDEGAALKTPAKPAPPPTAGFRAGHPCSAYYQQQQSTGLPPDYQGNNPSYVVCGYDGAALQQAYGVSTMIKRGYDGQGVTIAITDAYASPTIESDANTYFARHGVPTFTSGQFTQVLPSNYNHLPACSASGWYGEETLDVEAAHSTAPGANIVYVGAKNCGFGAMGLDGVWARTIERHRGDIISNSWGSLTDDPAFLGQGYLDYYSYFSLEAALTGITVLFSSGDYGDEQANFGQVGADFPGSLPLVTAVGGTSIGIGATGTIQRTTGWETGRSVLAGTAWSPTPPGSFFGGAGGGPSRAFAQPWYQAGVVPSSMSQQLGGAPARVTPDISMVGDPNTGFLTGQTQTFPDGVYYDEYRIGGTSLSSPLMAGMLALASQFAGKTLGFVNPLIYKLGGTVGVSDVVPGDQPYGEARVNYANNVDPSAGLSYSFRTWGYQGLTIKTGPGYDNVTGVGTPNGASFFHAVKVRLPH